MIIKRAGSGARATPFVSCAKVWAVLACCTSAWSCISQPPALGVPVNDTWDVDGVRADGTVVPSDVTSARHAGLSQLAIAHLAAGCVESAPTGPFADFDYFYQDQVVLDRVALLGCTGDPKTCAYDCEAYGRCCSVAATASHDARCIAISDEACRASMDCWAGNCYAHCGTCVAMDDTDCIAWNRISYEGDRARFGECIVTPESCSSQSYPCNSDGDGHPCVVWPPFGMFDVSARCHWP